MMDALWCLPETKQYCVNPFVHLGLSTWVNLVELLAAGSDPWPLIMWPWGQDFCLHVENMCKPVECCPLVMERLYDVLCWERFLKSCYVWTNILSQIAKSLGSISTGHRPDAKVSDRCLIDIDLRVFAIWGGRNNFYRTEHFIVYHSNLVWKTLDSVIWICIINLWCIDDKTVSCPLLIAWTPSLQYTCSSMDAIILCTTCGSRCVMVCQLLFLSVPMYTLSVNCTLTVSACVHTVSVSCTMAVSACVHTVSVSCTMAVSASIHYMSVGLPSYRVCFPFSQLFLPKHINILGQPASCELTSGEGSSWIQSQ